MAWWNKEKSQERIYWESRCRIASLNKAFMDMVNCKDNPMTNHDLLSLIKKRPEVYKRFSGFIGKLADDVREVES